MTEPETDPSSQDPVEEVQKLIHALPDAKGITEENLEEVMAQLDAIDEAKAMFTEEQTARLDFNRYDEAAAAVMALMGMEGANEPLTISDIYETKTVSYMDENGKQTSHLAEIVTNQSYQNDTVIWGENSSSDRYYVIEGNVNIDGLIEVLKKSLKATIPLRNILNTGIKIILQNIPTAAVSCSTSGSFTKLSCPKYKKMFC